MRGMESRVVLATALLLGGVGVTGAATISLYFDVEVPDELKVLSIEYVPSPSRAVCLRCGAGPAQSLPNCAKPVTDLDAVR